MSENLKLTTEDKEYIFRTFQTINLNLADCIYLLNSYQEPDSKLDITKETLIRDLNYLMELNDFIKEKLK
jgi:hypothetical protein